MFVLMSSYEKLKKLYQDALEELIIERGDNEDMAAEIRKLQAKNDNLLSNVALLAADKLDLERKLKKYENWKMARRDKNGRFIAREIT